MLTLYAYSLSEQIQNSYSKQAAYNKNVNILLQYW